MNTTIHLTTVNLMGISIENIAWLFNATSEVDTELIFNNLETKVSFNLKKLSSTNQTIAKQLFKIKYT